VGVLYIKKEEGSEGAEGSYPRLYSVCARRVSRKGSVDRFGMIGPARKILMKMPP